ncbi:MAG: mercury methylation corrinoid protein HgcA [Syntrophomonadaceae bacterium]
MVFQITEDFSNPMDSVIQTSSVLSLPDYLGAWKARWGVKRMEYKISPGLYRLGEAGPDAPVLVTANYKMSFDYLRRELTGLNAWILVLDTAGINVWCAAGKGTFGTTELINRIAVVGLPQIVSHRTVIVPQLGATGVAAHEVRKRSGFKVVYGPVRAEDIPRFLDNDMKASPDMREVRFNFRDRLVLTPMELVGILKPVLSIGALLLLLHLTGLVTVTWSGVYPYLGAVLIGAVIAPLLLPFIPGRAFAWKGWILGFLWAVLAIYLKGGPGNGWGLTADLAAILFVPAVSSYLAMNFTGASTYTSLSGVKKEMKLAVPIQAASAAIGLILIFISLIKQGVL